VHGLIAGGFNVIDVKAEVLEAEGRIRPHIRETPLEHSPYLSRECGCGVYLKLENLQISGSFKLRGAMNKLLSLSEAERARGVVTASSGNHGAAFAYTLQRFGWQGTVYLPRNASPAKVEALRLYGAEVKFHGEDCVETEAFAKNEAAMSGRFWLSPYNDPKVVGGQGTVAIELERQLERFDTVLVPVGGGGLASGLGGYLKQSGRQVEVIGCLPENSPVMYESVKAGRIVETESKPTLSDGTAGGIEQGSITFDLCRSYVDDYILLSEDEIAAAIRLCVERHFMLIEGSAALPIAALLKQRGRFKGRQVVLILTGAKISLQKLLEVLSRD
jgi:threonine dehydratase